MEYTALFYRYFIFVQWSSRIKYHSTNQYESTDVY